MKLQKILQNIDFQLQQGNLNIEIQDIIYDSRKVEENTMFIALKGYNVDGHNYIEDAINRGSKCIVVEKEIEVTEDITVIKVENTRKALAHLSSNFFQKPENSITTIAITGTKGKTTTTFMIKKILEQAGKKVGIIGTNGVFYNDKYIQIENTTPESYEIYKYLRQMVEEKIEYVAMEVSSQALKYDRCDALTFDYGVFTNLTHDHISDFEHPNMEDYIKSKSLLFQKCNHGILNIDDVNYSKMIENATCKIHTFGYKEEADVQIKNVELIQDKKTIGINMQLANDINDNVIVNTPGKFSSYNAACAITVCNLIGASIENIKEALKTFSVKGRVEPVPVKDNVTFIIDYAHNGVSMESIVTTMRQYNPKRLITIFGCGGNRSKDRRYEMGEVSGKLADLSIITSDNPRFEDPNAIIDDILIGMHKTKGEYITIVDRKEAIKYAIDNAKEKDIILLLGKGHENYQEIEGVKYHFDDKEEVEKIINNHV